MERNKIEWKLKINKMKENEIAILTSRLVSLVSFDLLRARRAKDRNKTEVAPTTTSTTTGNVSESSEKTLVLMLAR